MLHSGDGVLWVMCCFGFRKAEEEAELKSMSKRLVESAIHRAVQQYLSEGSSLCGSPGGCGPLNALGKETSQEDHTR
uniref:A-kinase anchor protein 7 RI-RII subunit-binding domain-containing protein n=1 Tax=Eptatretus burgeri TaxID=7764 RepID=A0A8C4X0J0_EPTBU